jgi:hypothetical protein
MNFPFQGRFQGRFHAASLALATLCSSPSARQQQSPPPQPQTAEKPSSTGDDSKKEKKVWTNDNLSDAKGSVSVVGTNSKGSRSARKPDAAYIENVRKQLGKLRGQLTDIDKQIIELKEFNEGEGSGQADRQLHKGYNMQPVDQQIRALEAKRKEIQAKIDDLLDEARKKGIEPGELR